MAMSGWPTGSKLPHWAKRNKDDGFVEIDPNEAYPLYLHELGLIANTDRPFNSDVTKMDLETVQRCIGEDLKRLAYARGIEGIKLRYLNAPRWALVNFPGTDEEADAARLAFRVHYERIRPKTPDGGRLLALPQAGLRRKISA